MADVPTSEQLAFDVSSSTVHVSFDGQINADVLVAHDLASHITSCEMYAHTAFFFVVSVDTRALGEMLIHADPHQWFHVEGKLLGFRFDQRDPSNFAPKIYATSLTPLAGEPVSPQTRELPQYPPMDAHFEERINQ